MFFRYLNTFKSTTINYVINNYNDLRMSRMEMKFFKIEKTRSISFFHRFFFFYQLKEEENWTLERKLIVNRWPGCTEHNVFLSFIDKTV